MSLIGKGYYIWQLWNCERGDAQAITAEDLDGDLLADFKDGCNTVDTPPPGTGGDDLVVNDKDAALLAAHWTAGAGEHSGPDPEEARGCVLYDRIGAEYPEEALEAGARIRAEELRYLAASLLAPDPETADS